MFSEGEHFDFEFQVRVWWDDRSGTSGAISEFGWADNGNLITDGHSDDSLVPTWDDLLDTDSEVELIGSILGGIEFRSLKSPTGIVNGDIIAYYL